MTTQVEAHRDARAGGGSPSSASTCGGVTDSRESARDKATKATCDRYQSCGLIGPGATYATYDSCSTVWTANWEQRWPVATCEVRSTRRASASA